MSKIYKGIGRKGTLEDINYINLNKDLIDYYTVGLIRVHDIGDSIFGYSIKIGEVFEYLYFDFYMDMDIGMENHLCSILRKVEYNFEPITVVIQDDYFCPTAVDAKVLEVRDEYLVICVTNTVFGIRKGNNVFNMALEQYNLKLIHGCSL